MIILYYFQSILDDLASEDTHLYSRVAVRANLADDIYAAKWFNGFSLKANSFEGEYPSYRFL